MTPAIRAALEAARHELTTLHGLHAHDGNPAASWRVDTSATRAQIDAVLDPANPSTSAPQSRQTAMIRHPEHTL